MYIEPLAEAQVEAVVAPWGDAGLIRPWNDPRTDIALARRSPSSEVFVGLDGSATVASVMCGWDGHRGWLYYLAVSPARRGQGLGRTMVRHAEDWLRKRGCTKAQLMIREENSAVRDFYAAVGYRQEPRVVMSRRFDR